MVNTTIWTSFIGLLVYPVGGEGMGIIVVIACCEYHFIGLHEILVQHPSITKSITVLIVLKNLSIANDG